MLAAAVVRVVMAAMAAVAEAVVEMAAVAATEVMAAETHRLPNRRS